MWKNLPRDLKILLYSTILANTSGRMIDPFMPLYILALGGTVAQVGLFFTVNTLAAALMRPAGGWFSDAIGRVQAVAIGGVFSLLGFAGYAISPSWGWLIVSAVVLAVGRSIVGPSYQSFIAESAPKEQLAQTFGLVNGLFTICQIVGPVLGGWLIDQYEIKAIFWVGLGLSTAAALLRIIPAIGRTFAWHTVKFATLRSGLTTLFTALTAGGLLTWLFVTDSVRDVAVKFYDNFQPLLLEQNGIAETQIGVLFSFHAVVYLLVNIFGSRLADRWTPASALAASGFLQAAALLLLALFPTPPMFWLFFALSAVSFGMGDPAFDAFLARSTSKETLGLTFGLFSTAISIFSAPAPYLGSLLWAGVAPTAPFVAGAFFMVAAGLLTWFILGRFVPQ